jgi:ABC-type sugar transport system permease subunit
MKAASCCWRTRRDPGSPSSKQWLLTLPSLAWLGVFFVIPAILVVVTAFRPADLHGGVGAGWTIGHD